MYYYEFTSEGEICIRQGYVEIAIVMKAVVLVSLFPPIPSAIFQLFYPFRGMSNWPHGFFCISRYPYACLLRVRVYSNN